jgi:flagellar motor switch protein FliN/FliY
MSDQETTTTPETGETESAASVDQTADAPPKEPRSSTVSSQAAPLLMGVKLPIRVLLGRTNLSLRDVSQLGNGAVVELDCSPDDPVEIVVNDRVIAHGEVVVVSGNYGVRITKIASRQDEVEAQSAVSDLFSLSQKLR